MTRDDYEQTLRGIALLAAQMQDVLQRVIDAIDERLLVQSWTAELAEDLRRLEQLHKELDR